MLPVECVDEPILGRATTECRDELASEIVCPGNVRPIVAVVDVADTVRNGVFGLDDPRPMPSLNARPELKLVVEPVPDPVILFGLELGPSTHASSPSNVLAPHRRYQPAVVGAGFGAKSLIGRLPVPPLKSPSFQPLQAIHRRKSGPLGHSKTFGSERLAGESKSDCQDPFESPEE